MTQFERFSVETEELSQLILCSNQMELKEAIQFNINSLADRKKLLIQLHKKIKPPNYIVPNRLEQLISQGIKYQILRSKFYHPNDIKEFPSLLDDYTPPPLNLPSHKLRVLEDHEDEVWLASLSQSEKKLATVSANKRLIIYAIDPAKVRGDPVTIKKVVVVDNIHSMDVTCVMWNFDESRVITCSKDKSIKMWNWEDGKLVSTMEDAHQDQPTSLARLEGTRDFFSAGADGHINCWDSAGNKVTRCLTEEIPHQQPAHSVLVLLSVRQAVVCRQWQAEYSDFRFGVDRRGGFAV